MDKHNGLIYIERHGCSFIIFIYPMTNNIIFGNYEQNILLDLYFIYDNIFLHLFFRLIVII